MSVLADLAAGFAGALTPWNLLMCFAGVFAGQLVGALPGIGPSAAIALLLPLTFGGDPTSAIILFAGIYYGAQYGGTLTSVLISVPGEPSSVMTSLDGYQMALKGRAGTALGIAAIGSFFAGTIATLGLMILAPPLARAALAFGPPEYFALVVLGLTALAAVGGSVLKGLSAGVFGLLISTIGIDQQTGVARFAFDQVWLLDGIGFIVITVALFGIGEVLSSVGKPAPAPITNVGNVLPSREEWRQSRMPILRGSVIGFLVGVLPATGATIASFIAYIVEKKVSRNPEKFGTGAIEGVAGPEASNNAAAGGAMVPMLALGVPGSGTTAIILGALIMFGIRPGPELFDKNSALVWTVIASMYIGNVMLLVMNLPLAGLFAKLLRVPYPYLYPPILALCVAGVYSQANSIQDVWMLLGFGVLGWLMMRYDWPAAPMILGLVLGVIFENSLRQSMTLSHGSLTIFFTRPVSAFLLACSLLAITAPLIIKLMQSRKQVPA
ncbi:MAG: tripartite tricarboxylate transporter permease [Methylobacterium sp.]|jgi:putative tricarboxylic transport membrane protein|nr:tripartite tricarboxylate transporter permease [Rhodobacter sp.]MCA3636250.1 tripartite tricarboxylate transporter permease [Methylobacterium sp.]MCA3637264.1 tripartite tricarboxylate transporter permease [Methylobacterium sp.]MCA3659207.1 tripartite tricarboxylate transporter permease [Methylobacterium sp.]MCA3672380.1 tripartite tricarboxylate transporter permease [Methylobacterium sp.]